MRTVNFSDARGNLKEVLDNVTSDHTITLIKRRDSEDAVLMSLSDYNSLQETLHLFSSPANAVRLLEAMAEADAALPPGARVLGPEDFAKRAPVHAPVKAVAKRKALIADRSDSTPGLIRRHVGIETKVKAGNAAAGRVLTQSKKGSAGSLKVITKAATGPKKKA